MLGLRHAVALVAAAACLLLPTGARADSLDPPVLQTPAAAASLKTNPTFAWSAVPRAAKYRIQVATTPTGFNNSVYSADVFGTSATPPAELPLGALYWHVATYDWTGTLGSYSAVQAFQRNQADPPALVGPANGAQLKYPADDVVLSWSAVAGVASYTVQIDDETTFTNPTSYTTAGTSLAVPTALPSSAVRYWRVQGVSTNPGVTTAWSDVTDLRSFTVAWPSTAKPAPLTPPDDATFATDVDDVEFTWSAVDGAARYELQTSTAPDFTANLTDQLTAATHFRNTGALTQDQYYWRVRALQPNGEPTVWSPTSHFQREWLDVDGLRARPVVTIADQDPLVAGTQMQQNRISVDWTPVRGADYYEIDVSTNAGFPNANPVNGDDAIHRRCQTPNTSWTPYYEGDYSGTTGFGACGWTGTPTSDPSTRFIVQGGLYFVRVRAVDKTPGGDLRVSTWSNASRTVGEAMPPTASFTSVAPTDPTTPDTEPAHPILSPDSDGTPKLTWQPVAGAAAYRLMLARDSSFNSLVLSGNAYVVTPNTELVLNEPLLDNQAGQPYFWYVIPCASYSKASDPPSGCTVGANQAINQPQFSKSFTKLGKAVTNLSPAPDTVLTDDIRLSWRDHLIDSPTGGGMEKYEVEIRDASDAVVTDVYTDATGYSPMEDPVAPGPKQAAALPDGHYTWRVRAIDAGGKGLAWSTVSSFYKDSSKPVPQTVAASSTLPVLRWSPTAHAGSYDVEVYRGVDPSFPVGSKVGSVNGLKYPAYSLSAAMPADTYSWRVRQVDPYGNPGPWSTTVKPFTIGGATPALQAPADAAAAPLPGLKFTWAAVPGAVRYRVETSTTQGFGSTVESVDTTQTSLVPGATYTGGSTYYWRVSVLNAANDVLGTSPVQNFTAQTQPGAPSIDAAVNGGKIDVSWNPGASGGSPATGYIVRYRAVGTQPWTEVETAGDVQSFSIDDVSPSQSYEAQVAGENAVGVGAFSPLVTRTAPSLPKLPTNLKLTAADRGFGATWAAPATTNGDLPITGYVVRVTPTGGGATTETPVPGTSATVSGLEDGTQYTVDVAAVNGMGRGPYASATVTTPGTPPVPDTAINAGPLNNGSINVQTASFTFSGAPSALVTGFECSLDSAPFAACTSPHQLSGLSEGSHSFAVRTVDNRDRRDATPAVRQFTVDLTAPETQIDSGPDGTTSATSATFTYSSVPSADAARFECKLDGAAFALCPSTGRTIENLALGAHTFVVRAIDGAGNLDATPATREWTVVAPQASPTPTPTVTPTPTPKPVQCKVPKLKGLSRAAAQKALAKAHCALGKVKGKGKKVKSQSPAPGAVKPKNTKVSVVLAKR